MIFSLNQNINLQQRHRVYSRVDTRNYETAQRELYTPLHSLVDMWVWPGTTQGSREGFLIDPKRWQGGVKIGGKCMEIEILHAFSPLLVVAWDQSGSLPQTPEWYQATPTCPLVSVGGVELSLIIPCIHPMDSWPWSSDLVLVYGSWPSEMSCKMGTRRDQNTQFSLLDPAIPWSIHLIKGLVHVPHLRCCHSCQRSMALKSCPARGLCALISKLKVCPS